MDEDYLRQKLEWVKYRLEKLDQIQTKLTEMKQLAEYARDNKLSSNQIKESNAKLQTLEREVIHMDAQSKTFWLDEQ